MKPLTAIKPLTAKQKKVLKIVAVPVIYFIGLIVFVRLTFPYDTLRDRVLAEFNSTQTDKHLEIEEMSGNGILGVEVEGLSLVELMPAVADEEGEPAPPNTLFVESAAVSVSAFSYLLGNISADFEAIVGGGEIAGSFQQDSEEARISVEGMDVDISGLSMLSAGIGLPMGGSLSGKVDLFLPEGQMKKAEGDFSLQIQNLTAGDGKAKIRNTIALPKLDAGTLVFKAEAAEGRLEISEFSVNGKDFELDASGQLRLREPFDKSSVSVNASFRFKEAYTNKSDLTRGIFGSPDSKIPALFDMDPMVRRAKQSDGSYIWQVSGLLSKPTFRPGTRRSGGKKRSGDDAE